MTNGQGTMKYENGNVYVGELKNDERHGQGKMTYKDGSVYEGLWIDDAVTDDDWTDDEGWSDDEDATKTMPTMIEPLC